jgi:hypothetical protein
MPFINKDILLAEFLQAVRRRILQSQNEDARIFFDSFLGNHLLEEIKADLPDDWSGSFNAGDFDELYPLVAEILFDAATRNDGEGHANIYEDASAVSLAFCEEMNEVFQCSGNETFIFIPIKSFSEIMIESGRALSADQDSQG